MDTIPYLPKMEKPKLLSKINLLFKTFYHFLLWMIFFHVILKILAVSFGTALYKFVMNFEYGKPLGSCNRLRRKIAHSNLSVFGRVFLFYPRTF